MRQKSYYTILFVLISSLVAAQGLLDTAGSWSVLETHCFPWGNSYSSNIYRLSGDTSIQDISYQKFLICDDENQQDCQFQGGLIRETADGKVFYRRFFEEEEGLIYDFSADEGDSLEIFNSQIMFDPVIMVVSNVDSVLSFNGYRKRISLESLDFIGEETWIEGVGSIYGVVYSCLGIFGGACGLYELLCFESNGELIYQNEDHLSCFLTTVEVKEPMFEAAEYSLYPNPAQVYITVMLPEKGEKTIYMYDFFGRMVYVSKTLEEKLNLDVNEFEKGTYFIHIKDSHGNTHHEKIIIQ